MILYLVRHGQSEGNIVTYDVPDGYLTPVGLQQAEETARRLESEQIDLIISSPLRRALQTAQALRRRTGARLEVWRDTLEHRDTGLYTFLGRRGVAELCPDSVCDDNHPDDGFDFGLETPQEAHDRSLQVFERLRSRFAETEQRVALFAHGGFNAFFLMALMGRPRMPGCWIEQNNCCVNRVWVGPRNVRILSMNDTSHLNMVT